MHKLRRAFAVGSILLSVFAMAACSDDSASSVTTAKGLTPALPNDVNPIPYTMNMLAGMGNVQVMVTGIEGNAYGVADAPERDISIAITFRNAALTPVKINKDSFRIYTSDLNSVTPENDPFALEIPADTKIDISLKFHVAKGLLAVGLVFDSEGYGDRVISGQFIVNPEYTGIENTDS